MKNAFDNCTLPLSRQGSWMNQVETRNVTPKCDIFVSVICCAVMLWRKEARCDVWPRDVVVTRRLVDRAQEQRANNHIKREETRKSSNKTQVNLVYRVCFASVWEGLRKGKRCWWKSNHQISKSEAESRRRWEAEWWKEELHHSAKVQLFLATSLKERAIEWIIKADSMSWRKVSVAPWRWCCLVLVQGLCWSMAERQARLVCLAQQIQAQRTRLCMVKENK